jgi:serine/threonine protein kinase/tetratricopeptide (TPR) repeat protein
MPPISPDRWRALSPYLDEALEIEPAAQPAWLASISARDPALADDLRSLLAGRKAVHDSGFLEGVVVDPRLTFVPSLAGQVLGSYRLISPIGQGGSGNVWLAERCDGRFHGRAAVKLLNIALVERGGEARFKREGTILAGLRHPHIAHLVDAGISQTGQPYLELEHIDGQPIDQYCESAVVSVEGRVRLFLDVLDAVAHAHASLVVHRDIKPANVLVSKEGGVKLLDFGIAKLIERDAPRRSSAGQSSAFARDGGSALTPQYAAPEQLSGGEITTATDIYALGVLLYVLLSGRHPAGDGADTPAKLLRAIVEMEAPALSDAVGSGVDPQRLARHATECASTPAKLRRALAGDLEAIVGKALRKNPAERYASVDAFADDLRRHLQHEPVGARQQTFSYRTARFVRRHPGSVSATAAAVLLVAGLTGVYTGRLAAQRNRAQREAAKAIKVSELMMGLLTTADPYTVRGAEGQPTSVRAVLDAGAAQVRKELAGEPELQIEMLTTMGWTYRRLAAFDKAQPLLEEALASGRQVFGNEHVQVAQTLNYLGVVLADKGDYRGAGQRLEEALAMRRKLLGLLHPQVAVTLAELGRVYQDQGLNQRAEPLHREALDIRRKVQGAAHRETAVSESDLASVLRFNGDLAGAESLLRQSYDTNVKTRGAEHPNTAAALHDLALISAMRGEAVAAEPLLRKALAMQRQAFGNNHPVVAATLNSLSRVLLEERRYDEAAAAEGEAAAIATSSLGPEHQLVAIYTINLAAVNAAGGKPAAAEPLLREGLRIRSRAPGIVPTRRRTRVEDDWSVGAARSLLGEVLTRLRRFPEAETTLLDARRDLESLPATGGAEMKLAYSRLVDLYFAWGKPARAASFRALLGS